MEGFTPIGLTETRHTPTLCNPQPKGLAHYQTQQPFLLVLQAINQIQHSSTLQQPAQRFDKHFQIAPSSFITSESQNVGANALHNVTNDESAKRESDSTRQNDYYHHAGNYLNILQSEDQRIYGLSYQFSVLRSHDRGVHSPAIWYTNTIRR